MFNGIIYGEARVRVALTREPAYMITDKEFLDSYATPYFFYEYDMYNGSTGNRMRVLYFENYLNSPQANTDITIQLGNLDDKTFNRIIQEVENLIFEESEESENKQENKQAQSRVVVAKIAAGGAIIVAIITLITTLITTLL